MASSELSCMNRTTRTNSGKNGWNTLLPASCCMPVSKPVASRMLKMFCKMHWLNLGNEAMAACRQIHWSMPPSVVELSIDHGRWMRGFGEKIKKSSCYSGGRCHMLSREAKGHTCLQRYGGCQNHYKKWSHYGSGVSLHFERLLSYLACHCRPYRASTRLLLQD